MARGRKRNQKRKPIDAQKETTTNDESAGSGTDGTEQPFDWTTERVLALLNCMIRRKPAGMHKHANMILIKTHLSERLKMDVPIKEIWKFLHAHWDMDEADKIEFQVTNIEKKDFELPQTEEWTQLVEEQGAIIREAENKNKDGINGTLPSEL